jgi:hypothetical protein
MVIVGFVQSIAIAKRIAYKRGYEIDSSQELISLGLANLVGSMFQSYPTTGCLGQSAINDDIGAETGVASVVTGLVVMLVLLFLTPVFEKMPFTVLAAIVISFVLGMFVSFLFRNAGSNLLLIGTLTSVLVLPIFYRTIQKPFISTKFIDSISLCGSWRSLGPCSSEWSTAWALRWQCHCSLSFTSRLIRTQPCWVDYREQPCITISSSIPMSSDTMD